MFQALITSMDVMVGSDAVEIIDARFDAVEDVSAFLERNMWNPRSICADFYDIVVIFKEISKVV